MSGRVKGVNGELVPVCFAFSTSFPVVDADLFFMAHSHIKGDPDFGISQYKAGEFFVGKIMSGWCGLQCSVDVGCEESSEAGGDAIGGIGAIGC